MSLQEDAVRPTDGEPDALKGASPVRRGEWRNVLARATRSAPTLQTDGESVPMPEIPAWDKSRALAALNISETAMGGLGNSFTQNPA